MDKHIDDRLWKILGDNFEAEPSGYFNFEKAIPQIKALITTEQLAIWNKALELVGDGKAPEQITDGIKTGRRLQESWNKGFNHARAELRSAIQAELDKLAQPKDGGQD